MKNLIFSFTALSVLLCSSCGLGNLKGRADVTVTPVINQPFTAVDISAALDADITIVPGAATKITYTGFKEAVNKLKTEVRDNTLYIGMPNENVSFDFGSKDVKANITIGSLAALSISGATDANIHGGINSPHFKLDVSGTGNVSIDNLSAADLICELSGTGSMKINGGHAGNAIYDISGTGSLNAFPLQTDSVKADLSGTGSAKVYAVKSLIADVSGVGSIGYKGHPQVIKEVSGIGSVADAN